MEFSRALGQHSNITQRALYRDQQHAFTAMTSTIYWIARIRFFTFTACGPSSLASLSR
jgi:hypothetical protein